MKKVREVSKEKEQEEQRKKNRHFKMPFDLKNWSLFAWVSFRGGFGCWLDWPMKIGVIFVVGFSPILVNLKQRDTLVNPKA